MEDCEERNEVEERRKWWYFEGENGEDIPYPHKINLPLERWFQRQSERTENIPVVLNEFEPL